MTGNPTLASMLTRRSVSPKRLCAPGPSAEQLQTIVSATLRAPDHGSLLPWRLIEFAQAQRGQLAALFEDEKRRRDPVCTAEDLARAREHAMHAPTVLAFVVSPAADALVPVHEQWLAAGAALGHVMLAAHYMGYGAIVLSGERCADAQLCRAVGVTSAETLAGFISIGTIAGSPPAARSANPQQVFSVWPGSHQSQRTAIALSPR